MFYGYALRTNLSLLNETSLEDFQRVGRNKELGGTAHFVRLLVSVCLYVTHHTARRDTLHTLPLHKITSDHKDRNMFAYILHTLCIHSAYATPGTAVTQFFIRILIF
jgi:hypothetical protein